MSSLGARRPCRLINGTVRLSLESSAAPRGLCYVLHGLPAPPPAAAVELRALGDLQVAGGRGTRGPALSFYTGGTPRRRGLCQQITVIWWQRSGWKARPAPIRAVNHTWQPQLGEVGPGPRLWRG